MRQAEEGKEFRNASCILSTVLRAGGTRSAPTEAERIPRLETEGLLPLSAAAIPPEALTQLGIVSSH